MYEHNILNIEQEVWAIEKLASKCCRDIILVRWEIEEDISQEPEVADPKCGISIMNIPPDRIHLVGVPELKSKIFDHLPLSL